MAGARRASQGGDSGAGAAGAGRSGASPARGGDGGASSGAAGEGAFPADASAEGGESAGGSQTSADGSGDADIDSPPSAGDARSLVPLDAYAPDAPDASIDAAPVPPGSTDAGGEVHADAPATDATPTDATPTDATPTDAAPTDVHVDASVRVCEDGDAYCDGDRLMRCAFSRMGYEVARSCEPGLCDAIGQTCFACTPGAIWCGDEHTRLACSADGSALLPAELDPIRFCGNGGEWVGCRADADCALRAGPCLLPHCDPVGNTCQLRPARTPCGVHGDESGACDGSGRCLGPEGLSCDSAARAGTPLFCQGVSCCQDVLVPGGTFPMGRGNVGSTDACPEYESCRAVTDQPEHSATVSSFYLDRFEVTVGRFRQFALAYDRSGSPYRPQEGAGAHPKNPGSGWQTAWNANLPASADDLVNAVACSGVWSTWPSTPDGGGALPDSGPAAPDAGTPEEAAIDCVSWYEAFAFCVWDGGRLPTEAEWEYAAAGGAQNRLYPWGSQKPDPTKANYGGNPDHNVRTPVGTFPLGAALFGHLDLAGGVAEWTLDWADQAFYADAGNPCIDCANIADDTQSRALRGGSSGTRFVRVALRSSADPNSRSWTHGVRCVRDIP